MESYIIKTPQENATEQLLEIENIKRLTIEHIVNQSRLAFNLFWFKGEHPNEKAKRLGTSAMQVFQDHAETEAFIKSKKPEHVVLGVPPQFELVWGNDGSVEILDVIEE